MSPPRRPLLWPWLLLLLLLVAGGIAAAYVLAREEGPTTRVPDVVGQSTADAVRELGERGYSADVQARGSSDEAPDRVLSQAPAGGTELDRGESVTIVVARGPSGVEVPRVIGLTESAARTRLEVSGFEASGSRVQSSRPRGIVVSQKPAAGARAPNGSLVTLSVSSGPTTTTTPTTTTPTTTTQPPPPPSGRAIPNVVGAGQREAMARLHAAGFRVDSYPAASTRPRGAVVSQRPAGGTRAARDSVVRINVSLGSGPRPLRVIPDVTAMPEREAKQTLADVGFTVRSVYEPAADSSERGVVLAQSPAPGGRASAGSQIVISVGR